MSTESDLLEFLDEHGIAYQRFAHPAVFTVEEALVHVPRLDGAKTKNLFLRDRRGANHYLVTVPFDKSVDLKALAEMFGVRQLGFASRERLDEHLGITPGAVSILAPFNDKTKTVNVCIDIELENETALQVHPLVNTATLLIGLEDVLRFLKLTGHSPYWIKVPARTD